MTQIQKQQVKTASELKVAFQKLINGQLDLIYAEDIKCSNEEFQRFNLVLNQIKNVNWIFSITVRIEVIGKKMFLEIKKKKGNAFSKYERIDSIEFYRNVDVFEDKYDIDSPLPRHIVLGSTLYKLKKEDE